MDYLWALESGDEMHGTFQSIEAAIADAAELAAEHDGAMKIEIFDSRPATEADKEEFDWSENVDNTQPDWWKNCVIPENIVRTHTFPAPAEE